MLNRLAFTNLMQVGSRYCGVKTGLKRNLLPNHTCAGSYHERRIIKRREYSMNHPWQLLPREIRADLLGGAIPTDTPVSRRGG